MGHCDFVAVSNVELDWFMALDESTTCPWMRNWIHGGILHGWMHKTPESYYHGSYVNAMSHIPSGTVGSTAARIHLDKDHAFTGYSALAHVVRHEVAHVFYPDREGPAGEAFMDSVANSCS